VQEAWIALDVPQCGTAIRPIMSASALLAKNPHPTDSDIDAAMEATSAAAAPIDGSALRSSTRPREVGR